MSIVAFLDIPVPPGRREAAIAVLEASLPATRAFDGNLGIEVLVDGGDEGHFLVLEHWVDVEHSTRYQAWRATPEGAIAGFGDVVAGAPSMRVYDVVG